ncbi:uncharacterized protein LOC127869581 [Dreissena polymorpha]|uniref:uncharacterized protein LOC127869581 n=1 Tax=Dreissena polymorpha TaxID=45954 RepID=UPI002263D7F6|nr:uncharacterized protein LOC127869581 [Dreissena polymorpha]
MDVSPCILFICLTTCIFDLFTMADQFMGGVSGSREMSTGQDQLDGYCNQPELVTGHEGESFPGYSLRMVQVLMSPGQSDISHVMKHTSHIPPSMSCDPSVMGTMQSDQLASLKQSVVEHANLGRSHPDLKRFLPTFTGTCARNHLSPHGFLQLVSIGNHFKESYLNKLEHKRMKPVYSSLHVETIESSAAYQSVLGLLHGMVLKNQFNKMKIQKITRQMCDAYDAKLPSCSCGRIRDLSPFFTQAIATGRHAFKNTSPHDLETLFKTHLNSTWFDTHLNSTWLDTTSLQLFRVAMQYQCPADKAHCQDWSLCNMFTREILHNLYNLSADYLYSLYTDPIYQSLARLKAYPFLQQVVNRATGPSTNQSMFVTFGDLNILQHVRTSLSYIKRESPKLASRLIFEIFQKNNGQKAGGELFFRILNDGEEISNLIQGCSKAIKLCPLRNLISMVSPLN